MDEIKVECKLNKDFNKWVPIEPSKDKITNTKEL